MTWLLPLHAITILAAEKRMRCEQPAAQNPQKDAVACILYQSSRRLNVAVPSWLPESRGSGSANILFVHAAPRALTSAPVFNRIFPWGVFILGENTKRQTVRTRNERRGGWLGGWGGLAVQSSHTGVAICSISTCKIQNVRQPLSNIQPGSASERLQFSSTEFWGHMWRCVALCRTRAHLLLSTPASPPDPTALHPGGTSRVGAREHYSITAGCSGDLSSLHRDWNTTGSELQH